MSLAIAGLFGIPEALATGGDIKVYAGNQCLPVDGDTVDYDDVAITPRSLKNDTPLLTGPDQDIICPVIRDVSNDDIDAVRVSILNDTVVGGNDDTECCLQAFTFDGRDTEIECDSADPTKTRQVIAFEGPELDDDFDGGYYTLTCTLEATEEIFGYRLTEG
ncbi:hypothetical protein [Nannocystis radixulma]|uniref:Uncharacterized protein n=1 Tax=Nannocystis radixulma TaxID=2995305 RepID=A0ABT5B674_9BACT|nr:hypothetical protein [Nannocystis radixulma]MDC0669029.1 hypothetical protein [Nannocystis radixulma]